MENALKMLVDMHKQIEIAMAHENAKNNAISLINDKGINSPLSAGKSPALNEQERNRIFKKLLKNPLTNHPMSGII